MMPQLPDWTAELDGFDGHLGFLPIVCTGEHTHAFELLALHYNHAITSEWVTAGPGFRPEVFPSTAEQRDRTRARGGRVSSDPRPELPPRRAQRVLPAQWTGSHNFTCRECRRTRRLPEFQWDQAIGPARSAVIRDARQPWLDVSII